MLKSIKEFLKNCPYTADAKNEFLGSSDTVALYDNGHETISRYIGGGRLAKFKFTIAVRSDYRADNDFEAYDTCKNIKAWILDNSLRGVLPTLSDSQTAQYFEFEDTPPLSGNDKTSAKYEINCRLVYYEKGDEFYARIS